jgi:hypothetical protein
MCLTRYANIPDGINRKKPSLGKEQKKNDGDDERENGIEGDGKQN